MSHSPSSTTWRVLSGLLYFANSTEFRRDKVRVARRDAESADRQRLRRRELLA
jgi:hypothetical protein